MRGLPLYTTCVIITYVTKVNNVNCDDGDSENNDSDLVDREGSGNRDIVTPQSGDQPTPTQGINQLLRMAITKGRRATTTYKGMIKDDDPSDTWMTTSGPTLFHYTKSDIKATLIEAIYNC